MLTAKSMKTENGMTGYLIHVTSIVDVYKVFQVIVENHEDNHSHMIFVTNILHLLLF